MGKSDKCRKHRVALYWNTQRPGLGTGAHCYQCHETCPVRVHSRVLARKEAEATSFVSQKHELQRPFPGSRYADNNRGIVLCCLWIIRVFYRLTLVRISNTEGEVAGTIGKDSASSGLRVLCSSALGSGPHTA